jgi:pyridoxine 4-dehydrogenase
MNAPVANASSSGAFLLGGDLPVNRLGYGTMRLVGDGAWGEPSDPTECRRILRRAVELGVTLIDTADAYGPEIAERLIGEALAPYADGVVIATKGGITRQGPAKTEYVGRAGYLIQCVEMSLRRLKLERIDLYQLHRIDKNVPVEESLGALTDMQREGKIRHIGVSETSVEEYERCKRSATIVSVQNLYNVQDRSAEAVLEACERDGIAFLPWLPLGGKGTFDHSALDRIAAAKHATPAQVALAWLLARSPNILPIPGTSSLAHFDENVAAAGLELSAADMDVLTSQK